MFRKSDSPSPATETARPLEARWLDALGRTSLRSLQVLIVIALAAVAIFAGVQLKLVVIPVLIAVILAAAFSPLVMFLRRHGWAPILATWTVLIGAVVVLGGIGFLIVNAVRGQWDALRDAAVKGFQNLTDFLASNNLVAQIDTGAIVKQAEDFLTSSQFGSGAIAGLSAAAEVITSLVLIVVLLFFFLKDGDVIWRFFLKPFRGEAHERGERVGRVGVRTLGGYVRGTATIALVDAVCIGIGLWILGVPLALPLAVLVFFGAFIPIVGATLTGVLAALVALVLNDFTTALWVTAIVIGVNQLEGNFLQPVVMAQSLKLHPLVVLVALTAGTILGGIIGAVLSVPVAAVAWAIIKTWNPDGVYADGAGRAAKRT